MAIFVFAADVGFINLDNAAKLRSGSIIAARILWHIQRGVVRAKAHLPLNLKRGNSLFAGRHQVHDLEPLAKRLVRVLKNRAGDHRKAIAVRWSALRALPMPLAGLQVIDRWGCRSAGGERRPASVALSDTPCGHRRRRSGKWPEIGLPSSGGLAWGVFAMTTTPQTLEGHGAEAHRVMGARAVPAGGFAGCSRAVWASCLPALRPGWEVHPWTGTGEGG